MLHTLGAGSCKAEGKKLSGSLVSADLCSVMEPEAEEEEQACGVVGVHSACLVTAIPPSSAQDFVPHCSRVKLVSTVSLSVLSGCPERSFLSPSSSENEQLFLLRE